MKTYVVTETYTVTRTLRVIAPDAEAARAWDVHPHSFVLDYGQHDENEHRSEVLEEVVWPVS